MGRNKNRNNGGGIPESVKDFAKMTRKSHKKDYGDYFDSKKELKKDYYDSLIACLPDVIDWLLTNSHKPQQNIQDIKNQCYEKLAGKDGPEFIKHITKYIDDYGVKDVPNIEYMPIILSEIIGDIIRYNQDVDENGGHHIENTTELFELSSKIMKKRLKKAKKENIKSDMAFDILSVIPVKDAIKYSPYFRVKSLFDVLYQYAAKEAVPFGVVIELLINSDDYKYVISYALQERKDKYRSFNETQKKLFNDITSWVFRELEDMDKGEIREILNKYIQVRKRDAASGKDSNRRYYISSLPENEYPTICKVVKDLSNVEENKKFL